MSLLLGIDLGTSYFKVGLFSTDGALRGLGRVPVATHQPAPGRCELPVGEFWGLLRSGLATALAAAQAGVDTIAGVSYASQANSFLLLDADDQPLTPLVLWPDTRAGEPAAELRRFSASAEFGRRIGFTGLTAQHAAVKAGWWRQHAPAAWTPARRLLTISDYLVYALTGERVGDAGTAALLGLYDLTSGAWWPPALDAGGIAAAWLARPLPPGTVCGRTSAAAGARLGLPAGIPFAVGGLDHHIAAVGAGLGRLADVSTSAGTVLAALALTATAQPQAGCVHGPHLAGNGHYRLAFDPQGAGCLEAYQRAHAPDRDLASLLALAEASAHAPEPSGGQPALAPRAGGGRGAGPALAMDDARHAAALRAIVVDMCRRQRALVTLATGGRPVRGIVATGGATRSAYVLRSMAAGIGAPVIRSRCPEPASLGAAILAAVAAGLHADHTSAAAAMVHGDPVNG